MSQFQIEPELLMPLPGLLRDSALRAIPASTLTSPDTGASTTTTRSAMDGLTAAVAEMSVDVEDLAVRMEDALALYAQTDGDVGRFHDLLLSAVRS